MLLAPCTLGGLMAASSNSPSVLLDTKEEMLLPHLTPSWTAGGTHDNLAFRRRGTVVTLDPTHTLAMPPLYTPFSPVKRSEYSPEPSMAHVAAAALAILLDAARSVDAAPRAGSSAGGRDGAPPRTRLADEMGAVASSCASVLELAAREAGRDDADGGARAERAGRRILDAVPRLSPLVERASLLARTGSMAAGTMPQRLASALLPSYFPQCHLVTYMACVLPGLCDAVSSTAGASSGGETSAVGAVASAIVGDGGCLSSWAGRATAEAGIPPMASLAYGTPDLDALVGSLDSYGSLVASLAGGVADGGGRDESWIMEDVLRRSLNR